MMPAKVTIVMPAYNAMKYLQNAVDSVLAQTYPDWELIIVDDASTDETGAFLDSLKDQRIRIFHNDQNRGTAYSRNFAVHEAAGEWIAFLDSDDMWRKDKLEKQLRVAEAEKDAVFLFTGSSFVNDEGIMMKYRLKVPERITYEEILAQNLISCSSVMIRKELIAAHPFPGIANVHEDFAVWLSILRDISYARGIDEALLIYRLADHSRSRNKIKAALMNWNTYRYAGVPLSKAVSSMLRYSLRSVKKYTALQRK